MSGYLDNELGPDDRARLEALLARSPEARRELERLRVVVSASSGLSIQGPPDDVWDTFLDNVYNRVERRAGWTILIVGVAALAVYGGYQFVMGPWASAMQKTLVATPFAGLGIVFVSVLRQRLFVAKTDRYSREVKR
jgi:anti-sigma factor RsiW